MTDTRLKAAVVLWILYAAAYVVAIVLGLLTPDIIPLLAGVPLIVASLMFALLAWPAARKLGLGVVAASVVQLVIAVLLTGGPGRSWHVGVRHWINAPGLPSSVLPLAWVVAAVMPLAITVVALVGARRIERQQG